MIPVFFTVSGAKIDLTAVASRPGLLVGFIVALLIIRAVPILISMSICPATRDVSAYGRITVALYCTTALPIIVAVTSVAVNAGALSQDIASVMVAAGAITVFLMPLLAQLFYRVVDAAPVAAVAEVAEHPSDALDILRAHHDLASLLAREHELLTSHGRGRRRQVVDTLSGKPRPALKARNGMWFPKRGPLGNCVPEWALRVGCSFRERSVAETVSQNRRSKRGALSETWP